MKRIVYILLMAIGMTTIAPIVSMVDSRVAAVYAADDKAKAKAKAAKEKEKAKKEKEKAKAKAAKEKEKAKAAKEKEKAKATAQKQKEKAQIAKEKAKAQQAKAKAKASAQNKKSKSTTHKPSAPELTAAQEKEQYMATVAAIERNNKRVLAYMNRDITHRLGFWGQVGYSNLFTSGINYDQTNGTGFKNSDKGFVGGGLGLGYQMRYQQFLMTVGAEFNFYNSVMSIANTADGTVARSFGMQPYASTMTYHYTFTGMQDKLIGGFVQIPLLFGMELKNIPLFWQAGVKVGMGLMGQSTISGNLTTTITDKELIGGMTNMYNHTLVTDDPIRRPATSVKFGLNVAASAEVGVNLDQWIKASPRLRASLFVDYGILNALSYQPAAGAQDLPMQFLVDQNPLNYPVNSALATTSAADAKVNPFLVGAKIAVWFDLPRKQLVVGDMPPKPLSRLAVYAFDEESETALGGADVHVTEMAAAHTIQKYSNRQGLIKAGRVKDGEYGITATKNGYFPSDTVLFTVEEFTYDTVRVPMHRVPEPVIPTLCLNIYDAQTQEAIEAAVRLTALNDTVVLFAAQSADDGFVETPLKAGDYIAHLSSVGYMSKDDSIHFVSDTLDLYMQPIKEGIKVKIENLFFATNKTYILPQSEQAMSDLAHFLLENPSVTIRITGHTDNVGSDMANQVLSEGRANSVRNDLIQRGVAAERITAEGKGEKEPVADNDTEEGRQLNRRVEFTITGTDGEDIQQIF